eukprot:TRINITY_DN51408_c0_g1_i1.p1 TRINITY_DN51408_c0_g1~~TRINITY_DN51408_c0_g1_i1.p1  ORF type:complete len:211 (+),score=45.60 TRINITY_DN51408_c0_g1_i1:87-719(+)
MALLRGLPGIFAQLAIVAFVPSLAMKVGLKSSPDYSKEASEISAMMDNLRTPKLVGDVASRQSALLKQSDTVFAGLDDDLLSTADRIQRELREQGLKEVAVASPQKKIALATEESNGTKSRAARFFATHGMKNIGVLLGDRLSGDAEQRAVAEADHARKMLAAATTIEKPPAAVEVERSDSSDWLADDDDGAEKQRWKAVDALRRRAMHV